MKTIPFKAIHSRLSSTNYFRIRSVLLVWINLGLICLCAYLLFPDYMECCTLILITSLLLFFVLYKYTEYIKIDLGNPSAAYSAKYIKIHGNLFVESTLRIRIIEISCILCSVLFIFTFCELLYASALKSYVYFTEQFEEDYHSSEFENSDDAYMLICDKTTNIVYSSPYKEYKGRSANLMGLTREMLGKNNFFFADVRGEYSIVGYISQGNKLIIYVENFGNTLNKTALYSFIITTITFILMLLESFMLTATKDPAKQITENIKFSSNYCMSAINNKKLGIFYTIKKGENFLNIEADSTAQNKYIKEWRKITPETKLKKLCEPLITLLLIITTIADYIGIETNSRFSQLNTYINNKQAFESIDILTVKRLIDICRAYFLFAVVVSFFINTIFKLYNTRLGTLSQVTTSVLKTVTLIIGILDISSRIGINTNALLISAGVLATLIGFGAQSIILDVISGISLAIEGNIGIGDYIMLGEEEGTVISMSIRMLKIQKKDGSIKIIRNSNVDNLYKLSTSEQRITVTFTIKHDSDMLKIEKLINKEIPLIKERHPDTLKGQIIYLGVCEITTSGPIIGLYVYADAYHRKKAAAYVTTEIKKLFDRNLIKFTANYEMTIIDSNSNFAAIEGSPSNIEDIGVELLNRR